MKGHTLCKFIKQWRAWQAGQEYWIGNGVAIELIRRGFCERVEPTAAATTTDKVMTAPPVHRAMRRKRGVS